MPVSSRSIKVKPQNTAYLIGIFYIVWRENQPANRMHGELICIHIPPVFGRRETGRFFKHAAEIVNIRKTRFGRNL